MAAPFNEIMLHAALNRAVQKAFDEVGLEGFKKTSLLMSNKVPLK